MIQPMKLQHHHRYSSKTSLTNILALTICQQYKTIHDSKGLRSKPTFQKTVLLVTGRFVKYNIVPCLSIFLHSSIISTLRCFAHLVTCCNPSSSIEPEHNVSSFKMKTISELVDATFGKRILYAEKEVILGQ